MTIKRDNGKGDMQRPLGVSMEVFDANFDAIFGKKTPKEQYEQKKEAVLYDPRKEKTTQEK